MITHIIVQAKVHDMRDREAFDRWYTEKHMPEAIALLHPARSWRSWSTVDPSVHYAIYEFGGGTQLSKLTDTPEFKALVTDFSRTWDGKVSRTRDFVESVQLIES